MAILTAASVLALAYFTAPVWRALLVAAILAYLLNPLVNRLEVRWHGRRALATFLVYTLMVLIILGILSGAGAIIWGRAPQWGVELGEALDEIGRWVERPFVFMGFTLYPELLLGYLQRSASNAISALPVGSGWLGSIGENLLLSLIVLVGLFYLLRDGRNIAPALIQLLPPTYHDDAHHLLTDLDTVWRVSLRVQLIIFAVIGFLVLTSTALILWLFRRGWLPLSPVGLIILIVVVYAGIQQIDNLWLRPQYMGHALKLHPGIVFVALIAALALTGILGAIVIIPMLASLKILAQYAYHKLLDNPPFPAENP
ncbi:MAG: AI-2E family transporter [Chloroflexi bacterium]|nr:AI-2E family transporter [Chloroflexota bacterium]